ncbi:MULTISPECIES: bacteriocin immunity protein [Enterococcus]|uniref:Bacteriocin immunity protein n=1 Tax=Enterococcus mundtii TaxID=53346 RepID=A0A2T5DFN9_ENTMU|nr:bacteriocin immunity protein [Enterococcus mundtii]MBO1085039.1 bacteriocin immunity protein [Enterococcus mundtii]MDV7743705.1 bacteriocin immunity protein [Enterococcus mundtii]PTO37044.1 hypothetical protein C6N14_01890 [Enterococcus mundtii]
MSNLSWFSGGDDRRKKAEALITELIGDLEVDSENQSLRVVLKSNLRNLQNEGASVLLLLSRMNVEIANAIKKDGVSLDEAYSKKLQELISISNIRYG